MPGVKVSASKIAQILDLTTRRVQQLVEEGLPKNGVNDYPLIEAVHWYIRYLRNHGGGEKEDGETIGAQRLRLVRAKADKAEAELAALRRETLHLEEAKQEVAAVISAMRAELRGIPGRMAQKLSRMKDPRNIKNELQDEISKAINRAADQLERIADGKTVADDLVDFASPTEEDAE